MDPQDRRLIGFDARKWRGARADVARQAERLAGEALRIRLIAAGAGEANYSKDITVVTDREIRCYGRDLLPALQYGDGGLPEPYLVVNHLDIVDVAPPGYLDTVKIKTRSRRTVRLTCQNEQVAELVFIVAAPLDFHVLACAGYPFGEGETVRYWREAQGLAFGTPGGAKTQRLPYPRIISVDIGGRGASYSGGEVTGGGYELEGPGMAGILLGAAASAALNRLTTKVSPVEVAVETLLRVVTHDGELNLYTADIVPQGLDDEFVEVRLGIRRAAAAPPPAPAVGDDVLSQLERLASLRERGVLSDTEFAAQKARILGDQA